MKVNPDTHSETYDCAYATIINNTIRFHDGIGTVIRVIQLSSDDALIIGDHTNLSSSIANAYIKHMKSQIND